MYRIGDWIIETSGCIVELIKSQYINISTYRPLSGCSYLKLPSELRSTKKGLINIKNNNQKCFLWSHVSHINPVKIHPERITQKDKELANDLNYDGIEFPVDKEGFSKLKRKATIGSMFFAMKINCPLRYTFQIINLKIRWICCF